MEYLFCSHRTLTVAISQDDKMSIREFGLRRILKARQINARRKAVKTFTPSNINFSAEEYLHIINWMDCELSSIPFLAEINDDEIKSQIDND